MLVTLPETWPTPDFAPDRIAYPTPGRRSEAPAPTCTGRAAAEYWLRETELQAQARAGLVPEGLPWGDELTEGSEDFSSSLEEGVEYANGGWCSGDESDPESVVVLR